MNIFSYTHKGETLEQARQRVNNLSILDLMGLVQATLQNAADNGVVSRYADGTQTGNGIVCHAISDRLRKEFNLPGLFPPLPEDGRLHVDEEQTE